MFYIFQMLWGLVEVYSNPPPEPNSSSTNLSPAGSLCEAPACNAVDMRLFRNWKNISTTLTPNFIPKSTQLIVAQLILIRWSRTSVPILLRIALLMFDALATDCWAELKNDCIVLDFALAGRAGITTRNNNINMVRCSVAMFAVWCLLWTTGQAASLGTSGNGWTNYSLGMGGQIWISPLQPKTPNPKP